MDKKAISKYQKNLNKIAEDYESKNKKYIRDTLGKKRYDDKDLNKVVSDAMAERDRQIKALGQNPSALVSKTVAPQPITVFDKNKFGENTFGNASDPGYAATSMIGFWASSENLVGAKGSPYDVSMPLFLNYSHQKNIIVLKVWRRTFLVFCPRMLQATDMMLAEVSDFVEDLRAQGHDGVILVDEEFGGTSYVVFDSDQIKSADPITYDNQGNPIPLSQRFTDSRDIRYQTDSDRINEKIVKSLFKQKNLHGVSKRHGGQSQVRRGTPTCQRQGYRQHA